MSDTDADAGPNANDWTDPRDRDGAGDGTGDGPEPDPIRPEDFTYVYPPKCDRCETFANVVEYPEPGYWHCDGCGARGQGFSEPIWAHNDPGSTYYEGEKDPAINLFQPFAKPPAEADDCPPWRSALATALLVATVVSWVVGGVAWLTGAPLIVGALAGGVFGLCGIAYIRLSRRFR